MEIEKPGQILLQAIWKSYLKQEHLFWEMPAILGKRQPGFQYTNYFAPLMN